MIEVRPVNLIPEQRLMKMLSPLWRERFEKGLSYILENLASTPFPSWDRVAEQCAISPYHFHRMFKVIFGETPGQYVRRCRLQVAVYYLLGSKDYSVTDIALECGFSSSQSLAKALKRDLGMPAREIRRFRTDGSLETVEALMRKLGHPTDNGRSCMESDMVESMEFHQGEWPDLRLTGEQVSPPEERRIGAVYQRLEHGGNKALYVITMAHEAHKSFEEQTVFVGVPVTAQPGRSEREQVFAGGLFLFCRVLISNETAYLAAWDAMYSHVVKTGLEPVAESYGVEIMHNATNYNSAPMDLTIAIKLQS